MWSFYKYEKIWISKMSFRRKWRGKRIFNFRVVPWKVGVKMCTTLETRNLWAYLIVVTCTLIELFRKKPSERFCFLGERASKNYIFLFNLITFFISIAQHIQYVFLDSRMVCYTKIISFWQKQTSRLKPSKEKENAHKTIQFERKIVSFANKRK